MIIVILSQKEEMTAKQIMQRLLVVYARKMKVPYSTAFRKLNFK